jgi:hypothetical protein
VSEKIVRLADHGSAEGSGAVIVDGRVDLAVEHGGVVFEVNVHPVLDGPGGLESVAVPWVEANPALSGHGEPGFSQAR